MKPMRKISRERDDEWALNVFDKAPYTTIGLVRPDGTPYAVPLNLIRTDNRTFYFHCATTGEKLDCILANPTVSLSAVSKCAPTFEAEKKNFTIYYHSAMAVGIASIVNDIDEKKEVLRIICHRFLPKFMDAFETAVNRSLNATTVVKITLSEPAVGKCREKE